MAARQGSRLRSALSDFLRRRLDAGAELALFFHWETERLDEVVVDVERARLVQLDRLEDEIASLHPDEVLLLRPLAEST